MRLSHALLLCATVLMLTRLFTLGLYPLYDTTEARYAEIARLMVQSQDWITPWFEAGIPFWGKPPAHTWITALSFELFGIHEWGARFAHWLMGLMSTLLVYVFAKRQAGDQYATSSVLILTSCFGFYVAIGMVMTDPALLFSCTLAMTSFWLSYSERNYVAGLMFFFACGLGMLIKGPVAVVIIGIALCVWGLWQRCLLPALYSLPWLTGLAIFAMTCLPWYVLAELKTPGFINYFIVGEHIQRFLEPGWQGDLYGSAHVEPKGKIWLFWLLVACPWSFILIWHLLKRPQQLKTDCQNEFSRYLIGWAVAPMLLFTFASNILTAYVLPGLPAFALLMAKFITQRALLLNIGFVCTALYTGVTALVVFDSGNRHSEKTLLSLIATPCPTMPVYYLEKRPFSARFYSCGQAKLIANKAELTAKLKTQKHNYLVLTHEQQEEIQLPQRHNCKTINKSQQGILLTCSPTNL